MNLKNYIQLKPQGDLLFCDLAPLLANSEAVDFAMGELVKFAKKFKLTAIAGIGGTGFIFGSEVARKCKIPFYSIQKKPLKSVGSSDFAQIPQSDEALVLQKNELDNFDNVLILDDVLATGNTMQTACELVQNHQSKVSAIATIAELTKLEARKNFPQVPIFTLVNF